jgi:hypothetical protein
MKNFVKDLSVIVVAVVAGLLFASAVQARGLENGFGNISIFEILQGNHNQNRHGHFRNHRRHNAYKHHGKKWHRAARRNRDRRVIYVVTQPAPAPVFAPVAAPVIIRSVQGNYCREFNSTAVIGGREVPVYGTMCRQPDGSWKTME